MWITTNCGKFLRRWKYQTTLSASLYIGQEATVRTGHGTWTGSKLEKVSFHSNAKQCSSYCKITLISQASKVMLKILQARLQQCVN